LRGHVPLPSHPLTVCRPEGAVGAGRQGAQRPGARTGRHPTARKRVCGPDAVLLWPRLEGTHRWRRQTGESVPARSEASGGCARGRRRPPRARRLSLPETLSEPGIQALERSGAPSGWEGGAGREGLGEEWCAHCRPELRAGTWEVVPRLEFSVQACRAVEAIVPAAAANQVSDLRRDRARPPARSGRAGIPAGAVGPVCQPGTALASQDSRARGEAPAPEDALGPTKARAFGLAGRDHRPLLAEREDLAARLPRRRVRLSRWEAGWFSSPRGDREPLKGVNGINL
jgi:hypothetical protein